MSTVIQKQALKRRSSCTASSTLDDDATTPMPLATPRQTNKRQLLSQQKSNEGANSAAAVLAGIGPLLFRKATTDNKKSSFDTSTSITASAQQHTAKRKLRQAIRDKQREKRADQALRKRNLDLLQCAEEDDDDQQQQPSKENVAESAKSVASAIAEKLGKIKSACIDILKSKSPNVSTMDLIKQQTQSPPPLPPPPLPPQPNSPPIAPDIIADVVAPLPQLPQAPYPERKEVMRRSRSASHVQQPSAAAVAHVAAKALCKRYLEGTASSRRKTVSKQEQQLTSPGRKVATVQRQGSMNGLNTNKENKSQHQFKPFSQIKYDDRHLYDNSSNQLSTSSLMKYNQMITCRKVAVSSQNGSTCSLNSVASTPCSFNGSSLKNLCSMGNSSRSSAKRFNV